MPVADDEPDERLLALADAQRRTDERIDALALIANELAGAMAATTKAGAEASARVPRWPDLDKDERAQRWDELLEWLNNVLLPRRSDLGRALSPCWYQHPEVVDELTMLYATWHSAYRNPRSTPTAVAEWLDRWFPNSRRRIDAELKECRRRQHVAKPDQNSNVSTRSPTTDERSWPGGIAPSGSNAPP